MMNNKQISELMIQGFAEWLTENTRDGWWSAYYVNFMFEPLKGSPEAVTSQMQRAIYRFYGRFSGRLVRKQHQWNAQQLLLPKFWLFPDKPVWKRNATTPVHEVKFNAGGLHYNGAMLIPRQSRLKGCPIEHINVYQKRYARNGISRIHVEPITDIPGIARYAGKTVRWGRADEGDILILPRARSEMPAESRMKNNPEARALKDMQAANNISDETAILLAANSSRAR